MKVELISYTPNPIQQMYLAAKRCVVPGDVQEYANDDFETMKRVVKKCIESGHLTIAEFVDFTFSIEGITRSCSHQLVRHRHASFCQMSERRVQIGTDEDEYYLEQEYAGMGGGCCSVEVEAEESFNKLFGEVPDEGAKTDVALSFLQYRKLLKNGVPPEHARSVLPQCTLTNLLMHVNFRALIEMSKLRLCRKAEKEIRKLFQLIRLDIGILMGTTFNPEGLFLHDFLQPKCVWLGKCNEEKPCDVYKLGKPDMEENQ